MLRRTARLENQARSRALTSSQAHPSRPPAVDFLALATSKRSCPVILGRSRVGSRGWKGSTDSKNYSAVTTGWPDLQKQLHPGLTELGIDEVGLHQDARSPSFLVSNDQKGRRGNKVWPKPSIWPRSPNPPLANLPSYAVPRSSE